MNKKLKEDEKFKKAYKLIVDKLDDEISLLNQRINEQKKAEREMIKTRDKVAAISEVKTLLENMP